MDIPRYRIGNDLTVLWAICNNDGTPFDLSGKGVRLFVTNERGMTEVVPTITTDKNGSITNVILWTFLGNNQKVLGKHTLTVEIVTADDKRVIKRDISDAFNLVARSEGEESGGEANAVDSGTIYLSTKLDVYRFGNARVEIGTNGNWFIDGYDTGRTALAGEPGIVHNIYRESDLGKEFDPDSKIDTFNAHAINAINNALKRMTLEQLQDLSLADLEEYDVLAYNGNAWLNVPFRDLLNIFKGPSESSSGIGDGFWYLNEQDGKIHTDIGIVVHGDAIVEGDTSSGGEGEDVVVGIQGVRVNGTTHYDDDGDGVVDLGTIESGGGGLTSVSWGDIQGTPPSVSTFDNDVPYVTDEELKPLGEQVETLSTLLSSMWHIDSNGNLVTDKQVIIKNNLIVEQDTSSGGNGESVLVGVQGISVNGGSPIYPNSEGIVELTISGGGGGTADLSNYYTKSETDAIIDGTFKSRSQIISNTNADQLLTNGVYLNATGNGSGNENIPVSYSILTTFTQSNNYAAQLSIGNGAFHFRRKIETWSDWAEVIHSGNIGSQSVAGIRIGEQIRTQEALDAFNDGKNLRFVGVGSVLPSPIVASDGMVISIPWYNTTFGAQIAIDDQSNVMLLRTRNQNVWRPWSRIIGEDDNGNVVLNGAYLYAKNYLFMNTDGEGIYLSTDAISWHNAGNGWVKDLIVFNSSGNIDIGGQINVSHNSNKNYAFIAQDDYTSNTSWMKLGTCYGYQTETVAMTIYNGMVKIGNAIPTCELDVAGSIKATLPIFGFMYGTNTNAAAFIFDKPGANYTGIGSDGVTDTIRLGACNVQGGWVDYNQKWKFYGDIIVTGDVASA